LFSLSSGWDSDMSSIMMLVHLLPPSSQGRKRPGKISVRKACDSLVKFIKVKLLMKQIKWLVHNVVLLCDLELAYLSGSYRSPILQIVVLVLFFST